VKPYTRSLVLAALTQVSLASVGSAQEVRRATVEWQVAPLADVVDALARFSGNRIVLPPEDGARLVTVAFRDTDWRLVLDSVLRSHALVARTSINNVLVVEKAAARVTTRFVTVDRDVRLEVIDWGGSGRAVVLLAGLGNTAHDLAQFGRALATNYHVYGITRRGFGESSVPARGYGADRLGDDVLAVIDSLQLQRPIVAAHSFGGEELSSIGSRHPEKVAGLIYLDAAYPYAFYNRARGNLQIDLNELRERLEQLELARGPDETRRVITALLQEDMPALERAIRERIGQLPPPSSDSATPARPPRLVGVEPSPALDSIRVGIQRYTAIRASVLAIYALPHRPPAAVARDSAALARWRAGQADWPSQAEAFARGVPAARVVFIPNADHALFLSENLADVLREIEAWVAVLPTP
jgi:non-heme chloroperoxidase